MLTYSKIGRTSFVLPNWHFNLYADTAQGSSRALMQALNLNLISIVFMLKYEDYPSCKITQLEFPFFSPPPHSGCWNQSWRYKLRPPSFILTRHRFTHIHITLTELGLQTLWQILRHNNYFNQELHKCVINFSWPNLAMSRWSLFGVEFCKAVLEHEFSPPS